MPTAKPAVKKLVLNRETVRSLSVNSAVRAGVYVTQPGQSGCPYPNQTTYCASGGGVVQDPDSGPDPIIKKPGARY